MTRTKNKDDILLAKIGAAHGIKGEVRVKPFGNPEMLDQYGKLHDRSGRKFRITRMRVQKTVLVVKFEGINTRNEAEELNGIELYVAREKLPEIEDDDEFYVSDLEGLEARSATGTPLGVVISVPNFGAGDLLEIRPENSGETYFIALSPDTVPKIDIAGGFLVIVPPNETSVDDGPNSR